MARSGQPKHKLSRRFGFDVFGTGGESLQRRIGSAAGPRGQAGAGGGSRGAPGSRRRRVSEYGLQLEEKQKAKAVYGLEERQLRRSFERAMREPGPPGANLIQGLERRLDNVVYRLGFARSRPMARQLVAHGRVRVDGRRLDIPSALVEAGQTVELDETGLRIPDVQRELEAGRPLPPWLSLEGNTGRVLALPNREDAAEPIDEQRIVAFFAR